MGIFFAEQYWSRQGVGLGRARLRGLENGLRGWHAGRDQRRGSPWAYVAFLLTR